MASLTVEKSSSSVSRDQCPYRVMLVDDSSVIRGLMSRWLSADPEIEVVASAANGQVAVGSIERTNPEIVVLDIEMPVMDGLTALPLILEANPNIQVLMSSTLTSKNAKASLQAMALGAADYVPKPTTNREVISSQSFQSEIVEKIKVLAKSKRKQLGLTPYRGSGNLSARPVQLATVENKPPINTHSQTVKASSEIPKIIAVGSSTGGPQALLSFVNSLKDSLTVPVVITQHMPATFTKILAAHLMKATALECQEGVDGMRLEPGKVYIAPGDHHMMVEKRNGQYVIKLSDEPPENFCRPAVDPMFRSVAKEYGPEALGVILTGMGQDGLKGSKLIVEEGGTILAQNEETSVVWGMPGAVSNAGICSAVLPLSEMGSKVQRLLKGGR